MKKRWLDGCAIVAVTVLGIVARVYQLPGQIIADDEWHSLYRLLIVDYAHIATHFGYADYSIPLTLYYKLIADTVGLDEFGMRLPPLLGGIAMLLVVPRIWRKQLDCNSYKFFVVLLSVSPLLIYFSRTARPYALTVLLASVALAACYHWWHEPDRRLWSAVYVACVVGGGYLHFASLLFTLMPMVFFGLLALRSAFNGDSRQLRRLMSIGFWATFLLVGFLGPPLYVGHVDLLSKSGMQTVRWHSLTGAVRLWVGTGNHLLIVFMFALSVVGTIHLWRRHRLWLQYCFFCTGGLFTMVILSRGAGLDEAIVLARYGLPVVPLFLMVVACGLSRVVSRWNLGSGSHIAAALLAVVLVLAGPLPAQAYYPNQFTGHMVFQSEYRFSANPYRFLEPERVPPFYIMLGEQPPNNLTIIEAPWQLAWHQIRLNFYQKVHRQRVHIGFLGGLCGSDWRGFTGEYPVEAAGLQFRNFVHLEHALQEGAHVGDYVVFHRYSSELGGQQREVTQCIDVFTERVGQPFYEDQEIVVFAVARGTGVSGMETP